MIASTFQYNDLKQQLQSVTASCWFLLELVELFRATHSVTNICIFLHIVYQ